MPSAIESFEMLMVVDIAKLIAYKARVAYDGLFVCV